MDLSLTSTGPHVSLVRHDPGQSFLRSAAENRGPDEIGSQETVGRYSVQRDTSEAETWTQEIATCTGHYSRRLQAVSDMFCSQDAWHQLLGVERRCEIPFLGVLGRLCWDADVFLETCTGLEDIDHPKQPSALRNIQQAYYLRNYGCQRTPGTRDRRNSLVEIVAAVGVAEHSSGPFLGPSLEALKRMS